MQLALGQERQVQHCEEGSHGGPMQLGQARRIRGGKLRGKRLILKCPQIGWLACKQAKS